MVRSKIVVVALLSMLLIASTAGAHHEKTNTFQSPVYTEDYYRLHWEAKVQCHFEPNCTEELFAKMIGRQGQNPIQENTEEVVGVDDRKLGACIATARHYGVPESLCEWASPQSRHR